MANYTQIRTGAATPAIGDLQEFQLGYCTGDGLLYIGVPQSGNIVPSVVGSKMSTVINASSTDETAATSKAVYDYAFAKAGGTISGNVAIAGTLELGRTVGGVTNWYQVYHAGMTDIVPQAQGGTGRTDGKVAALVTARKIGDANFDGSANITLAQIVGNAVGFGTAAGADGTASFGWPVMVDGNLSASSMQTGTVTATTYIELGDNNWTPFIDFHSGPETVDFDARIIASGGDGSVGHGTLSVNASTLNVNAELFLNNAPLGISQGGTGATTAEQAAINIGYTAADVLNKIKTVDGWGSGLDADSFRGTDIVGRSLGDAPNIDDAYISGWYLTDESTPGTFPAGNPNRYGILVMHSTHDATNAGYRVQEWHSITAPQLMWKRHRWDAGAWSAWYKYTGTVD